MKAPQHVLMTADGIGGVWTYAMELSRSLAAKRVRVSLAVMGAELSPAQRAQAARIPGLTVHQSFYKLEWMEDPWQDVEAAGEWLLKLEEELRPDVIHLNGFAHGTLQWRAPIVVAAHSCVLSWWDAVHASPAPGDWSEYKARVAAGLNGADAIVAVSRAMADEVSRLYAPYAPVSVVYNGIRGRDFAPARKEEMILAAGRLWDAAKNIAALDEAAAQLQWPVYVAGEPVAFKNLTALGRLAPEHLASWYARAAIFSLPARYEPFGYSPLEAALSGCALVLGDIPSLREIWGDAAVLVPPDDEKALAVALDLFITDKAYREEMGRRARARALQFSADRMCMGYLNVYSQVRPEGRAASRAGA